MDTQIFYRQKGATARYLEREVGYRSAYSHSQTSREGGYETQGASEQRVPLWTANQFKQMRDEDIIAFHHNLPPFLAQRMSWLEHPILKQRHAMRAPELSPLPLLTPLKLRSPFTATDVDDDLMNPGDFE
jgi:type IV secretory pathway TraG/TraD family ATPase VirD4